MTTTLNQPGQTSARTFIAANPNASAREATIQEFASFDGTRLKYREWLPPFARPSTRIMKAVILFHRGHEHSGRLSNVVNSLSLGEDVGYFAYDARGHGLSPGERGWAHSFNTLVQDANAFVHFIARLHDVELENIAIIGHSVGAVVAATWVHDYASPVRAMVLATPALDIRLYVPLAIPGLRAINALRGKPSFISSYVKPSMLTHDAEQAGHYAADPLISKQIGVNVLVDLHDTSKRIIADAGAIQTPTLVMTAGSDWVVNNRTTRRFYDRLSSPRKSFHKLDGFSHAIFHETRRELPIAMTREFLNEAFATASQSRRVLLAGDSVGYTKREFDRLSEPRSMLSRGNIAAAISRTFVKTLGRLSAGISLGHAAGFSSGRSLEHVYENIACGRTPLGRFIDRRYLNSIGWAMIRQRKIHLQAALREAMAHHSSDSRPIEIVDIAAGAGRYLIETLSEASHGRTSALLRDQNAEALNTAKQTARKLGVTDARFEVGDAFDEESLAAINPSPDIAIVSGLYELFPSNEPILESLRGLSRAMQRGATLIYTNQPWHPQLEFIARTLTHGDGTPWIMRRRTQGEMDALVADAGFAKVSQAIDAQGIFSVCVARKR